MIGNKVSLLQKQKFDLQVKLNDLLHSTNKDYEEISAIRAEIKKIDTDIEKIVGKKEIERQNELKKKKSGIEEINKKNYYSFKSKTIEISPMRRATSRMINLIEKLNTNVNEEEKVRMKVA